VGLSAVAAERHRLEVLENSGLLFDDRDRQAPIIGDRPSDLVSGIDIESVTDLRGDRRFPVIRDRRLSGRRDRTIDWVVVIARLTGSSINLT